MPRLIQASFARGEIGPDLYGRVDVSAYAVALRTALNCIIHAYGGVSNRSGLMFIAPCKTHTGTPPVLIEFEFNTTDTYILEFGEQYMRAIRNDQQILEATVVITGATNADPVVVSATAHGNANGDQVYIVDVVGEVELNGRWFTAANVTANTLELLDQQTGASIDGTNYGVYASGGTVAKIFEITTPYAIDDLLRFKDTQSANVMTLTHTTYPVNELSRLDHDDWTLEEVTFQPAQAAPTDISVTGTAGAVAERYKVTAINEETQEESLPGLNINVVTISSATAADPVVVTATAHGLANEDEAEINDFVEMTEVNGRRFTVANVTANTFELQGEDGTGYTPETTGGRANLTHFEFASAVAIDNTVTWVAAVGAGKYSVYRFDNGLYGWVGDTEPTSKKDDNIEPDVSLTPPKARNPFATAGNYPGVVSYYEQRRVFGNTNEKPDTSYYSVTGSQANMSQSSPRQADDAITATLNSRKVNEIRAFVPLTDLLVFTSGSEWKVNSGGEAAFSAETLNQKSQSTWGCSFLEPIVIADKILFVTENSSYVRSYGYEIATDIYKGNDMTVFAPHLFAIHKAIDWAYSRAPDPLIYTVREDGFVCCLTFEPEQEVVAWTRWNTSGKFLRVASTRPSIDSVDTAGYFVVQRTINGQSAYYIERVHSRRFTDVRECFFVDSGLSLDDPKEITGATAAYPVEVTIPAHGFTDSDEIDLLNILWEPNVDKFFNATQPAQLNGSRFRVAASTANTLQLLKNQGRVDITAATQANPIVITAPAHGYADGTVIGPSGVFGMVELNGNTYKVANKTVDTFELTTLADVNVDSTGFTAYTSGGQIYEGEDGTSFNPYVEEGQARLAVLTVGGLWHLEGREVVALADGGVVADLIVENGQITFPNNRKRSIAHIGLRYIADIETLDPEPAGGTAQGKSTRVPYLTVRVKDTRGMWMGPNQFNLNEMKQRKNEKYGEPTNLLTGDKEMHIASDWKSGGRVFIRVMDPLPISLTANIPFVDIGDTDEDEE